MTLPESIDSFVRRTGHERARFLCSDANPDAWSRTRCIEIVTGSAPASAAPSESQADAVLRAYLEKHGCGGCG